MTATRAGRLDNKLGESSSRFFVRKEYIKGDMASEQRSSSSREKQKDFCVDATTGSSKALSDDGKSSSATPESEKGPKVARSATPLEWTALACIFLLTYVLVPHPLHAEGEPSLQHVFYYGWLTAVSTGLGIVPLIFAPNLASYWVGVSNGMMCVLLLGFLVMHY